MNKNKTCIIFGTRPEIIKLFPLINILKNKNTFIIFSNQHYSKNMSFNFFNELQIKKIEYIFKNNNKKKFINNFYKFCKKILIKERPNKIILQGDTNTSLVGCLASRDYSNQVNKNVKIAHIEAGLRSYDLSMPEEFNRTIIDHNSDYLFVPTYHQKQNLLKEGIKSKKIFIVGNTIADSIKFFEKKLININFKNFILITFHRHELLENINRLKKLVNLINNIEKNFKKKIFFPIHPRTKKLIRKFNLKFRKNIKILAPQNYANFLSLINNSDIVLSDSGGLQEECCILNKHHITLRNNTERPETILINANIISKFNYSIISERIKKISKEKIYWESPYGRNVSKIIKNIIFR